MQDGGYDKEKTAALIKEAQAITAGLKCEIGKLQTQMGRVLDDRQVEMDEVDQAGSDPREVRGEQLAVAATIVKDGGAGKPFWWFWR
jgi:hypothetical protein